MSDSLYEQALLYACGELGADDVADFEGRLSGDQNAREALVAAVSIAAPSSPFFPAGPNPAYRNRVRSQLQEALAERPRERQLTPWLYALGGAASAVLIMLLINPPRPGGTPAAEGPAAAPATGATGVPQTPATTETIYSDLSNVDRVVRVRDQHLNRRQRQDDLRLPHGLLEKPWPCGRGCSM